MNFFGMGMAEILVVLFLAFVFLGPERMVSAARTLGKWSGEIRRLASDFTTIVEDADDPKGNAAQSNTVATRTDQSAPPASVPRPYMPEHDDSPAEEADAPVAHNRVQRRKPEPEAPSESSAPGEAEASQTGEKQA